MLELLAHEVPASFGDRASAVVHSARSTWAYADGNLSCALASARDALSAFRRVCAVRDVAPSLGSIGSALHELGVYDEAQATFEEAARITLNETVRFWAQINLGICHWRCARFDEAARILTQAVEGSARMGVRTLEGYALSLLITVRAQSGELEAATTAMTRALEIGESDLEVRAAALTGQARLRLIEGKRHEALQAAEQAMALLRDQQFVDDVAYMRATYLEVLFACEQGDRAQKALAEAVKWLHERAEKIDDPALRHSFLTNVPDNARVLELAARFLPPAS